MSRRPFAFALLALLGAGAILSPNLGRNVAPGSTTTAPAPTALATTQPASPHALTAPADQPADRPAPPAGAQTPLPPPTAPEPAHDDSHPSRDPALFFGVTGPVTLDEIPPGPFRDSLLALPPGPRALALQHLGYTRVPRSQLGTLRATAQGDLIHICPPGPHQHHPGIPSATAPRPLASALPLADPQTPAQTSAPDDTANSNAPLVQAAAVPISNPPQHSSRPNSSRVLYLDFNGHTVSGTAWNTGPGSRPVYIARPYDIDGNPSTFSEAEQAIISEVWARVAEDFAPFDVNVTTVEPSSFSSTTARVLITLAEDANGYYVPGGANAGGVAFLNVFGQSDYATRSPAWVIADNVGADNAANIAEVVSHEFGHNLGLSHDGTFSEEYYEGHGSGAISWGPIMGSSYGRNVTTFSKGEYRDANNTQDDLSIIAQKLPYRADDVPNDVTGSLPVLGTGVNVTTGLIERNNDIDRFRFTTASGRILITIRAFTAASGTRGNNLDLLARLYAHPAPSGASPLATYSPDLSPDITIDATFAPGEYELRLTPTGAGSPFASPPSGYTVYGSLGAYTITNNSSAVPPPPIVTQPVGGARPLGSNHTFTVVAEGTGIRYQWRFNGLDIPGATAPSLILQGLTFADAGAYSCAVSNSSATGYTQTVQLGVYRDTPTSITINSNSNTTLPTLVAGAFDNFSWSRNGTALAPLADPRILISGPVLRINGVQPSDAGTYLLATRFEGASISPGPVTVTVRPPVSINVPPVVTLFRGDTPGIPFTTSQSDLTFRYVGLPSGVGFIPATGALITDAPGPALGTYPITLFATDTTDNRGRADFTLVIQAKQLAVSLPATVATFGSTGLIPPFSTEAPVVSYRYEGLPAGFTFQSSTGRIVPRTATGAPAGTSTVTLTVTDAFGNTGSTTFQLEVSTLTLDRAPRYVGLAERHPTLNQNLGGSLTLTPVLSRGRPTGAYTGSLIHGAIRYSLSGSITSGGPETALGLTLRGASSGRPNRSLALTLPLDPALPATGTARAGNAAPVALTAWPARSVATATDYLGRHVFALLPPEDTDSAAAPAGVGVGTLAIAKNGRASWTTTLADGTRLTGALPLGRDGDLPVFALIAKPGGSLHGSLRLSAGDRAIEGTLTWLRARAPAASYAKAPLYRDGFGPLPLSALGGPVSPPPSGTRVLGLPDTSPNARLSFLDGGLSEEHLAQLAQVPLTVTARNAVSRPTTAAANPAALSLALQPSAGTFRGAFTLRDPNPLRPGATVTRKVSYQGVLLDGRGLGFFLVPGLRTDTLATPATRSGAVLLEPLTPESTE